MSFSENNPLGALFFDATTRYPNRVAIRTPAVDITYAALRQYVTHMAVNLRARGVGRGSVVGVYIPGNPARAATSIVALTLLGARWVSQDPTSGVHKIIKLTHSLYLNPPQRVVSKSIMLDEVWPDLGNNPPHIADSDFAGFSSADDPWFIATSSGTTGTSKYMAISGRMYFQRIMRYLQFPESGGHFLTTDFFGPYANFGFLRFLYTLHIGGTYVYKPDYEYLSAQNVNVVVGSPSHVSKFLDGVSPPDSPRMEEVRVGGAAASPKLLTKLGKYFNVVTVVYGSTETGPISAKRIENPESDRSVGRCYEDISVEIIDENGEVLAAETEGLVRFKASSQVTGYLGDAEATANAFKDGWFYPGDKGYLSQDGELYITGRVQDHLNIGGSKINAQMLDELMQSAADIEDALCFLELGEHGVEHLAALVTFSPEADKKQAVKNLIYALLAKDVHKGVLPRNMYEVSSVPRNDNGKPLRRTAGPLTEGLKAFAQVAQ